MSRLWTVLMSNKGYWIVPLVIAVVVVVLLVFLKQDTSDPFVYDPF